MQLHWVEAETGEIGRKKLARAKLAAILRAAAAGAHRDGGVRQRAPLGARAGQPGPPGGAAAGGAGAAVRAQQQGRCGRRAGDLAGGAAKRHPARAAEERRAAGGAGAAPHALALGERAHGHGERAARAAVRVRRGAARRPPGGAEGAGRATSGHRRADPRDDAHAGGRPACTRWSRSASASISSSARSRRCKSS